MSFDYQMYLRNDFFVPLGELVFAVFIIVGSIGGFIRARALGKPAYENLMGAMVALFFVVMASVELSRGIRLLHASEQDTVEIQGVIEEIKEPPFCTYYYIEGEKRSSQYIVIDGEKYYSASLPGISCGDEVKLVVYSNSRFVQKVVLIRKVSP